MPGLLATSSGPKRPSSREDNILQAALLHSDEMDRFG